jgi:hypothetical protein
MTKKTAELSQPAQLKGMTSEDIRNRRWTERERQALRLIAARQAALDDSRTNVKVILPESKGDPHLP